MSAETLELRVAARRPGFDLAVDERLALEGGVTALFGPNGAGKTTLLRAIAGFVTPAAGRIALDGDVWFDDAARVDVAPHRRPVGFMFQDARLFAHLDVAGNLAYAERRARRRAGRAALDREAVVAALDLEPLLARRVATLSGGERQRVALGRTLLARPRLLLLDEPLASLDRERKAEILPYLEELPRRFGVPAIYVSHAVDEVARLAARVALIAEGRVRAHGPTAAVFERVELEPLTGRFEAGAVVEARVVAHDRRLALTSVELDGETLTLPLEPHLAPGDRVRLRIRARDVAIATARPERISIRNVLPATVGEIAASPDTAFAEVQLKLRTTRLQARLTRASVEELGLTSGLAVFALIKSVSFDRRA